MKKILLPYIYLSFTLTSLAQAPDTLWTRYYGSLEREESRAMQITDSGEFVILSTFVWPIADIAIMKTDNSGGVIWQKQYQSVYDDGGAYIAKTYDGGFVVTGHRYLFGILLWKIDSNGDTIWTKPMIQGENEIGYSVVQHSDGGYLVAGISNNARVLVVKFDSLGIKQWAKLFGDWYGSAHSIIKTADNNYVVAGYMGATPYNLYLIKIDEVGNLIWEKTYRNQNNAKNAIGNYVQETTDSGLIVTGFGDFDIPYTTTWLLKTDANGDTLWTKILYGGGGGTVRQTYDGGFIVQSNAAGNGVLIKTDSNGNTLWTKIIGGQGQDYFTSVNQCSDFGYIISGHSNSFGSGEYNLWLVKTHPDITDINNEYQLLNSYKLFNNYPNPFNPSTKINYQIPELGYVTLKVFDVLGNEVVTLVDKYKTVGRYEVEFDARRFASGIYFYKMQAGHYTEVKKMILIK